MGIALNLIFLGLFLWLLTVIGPLWSIVLVLMLILFARA